MKFSLMGGIGCLVGYSEVFETGALEWWSNGVMHLNPTLQYSNTPALRCAAVRQIRFIVTVGGTSPPRSGESANRRSNRRSPLYPERVAGRCVWRGSPRLGLPPG